MKKLNFKKETIAQLNEEYMNNLIAGEGKPSNELKCNTVAYTCGEGCYWETNEHAYCGIAHFTLHILHCLP
ncbi:MAG: class I lanthipeptide [Hyphomicrobiales bacterium]